MPGSLHSRWYPEDIGLMLNRFVSPSSGKPQMETLILNKHSRAFILPPFIDQPLDGVVAASDPW